MFGTESDQLYLAMPGIDLVLPVVFAWHNKQKETSKLCVLSNTDVNPHVEITVKVKRSDVAVLISGSSFNEAFLLCQWLQGCAAWYHALSGSVRPYKICLQRRLSHQGIGSSLAMLTYQPIETVCIHLYRHRLISNIISQ